MAEQGSMSVREAGRRGGEKVRREYGPEYYEDTGRSEARGEESMTKIAREGAEDMKISKRGDTNGRQQRWHEEC